MEEEQESKAFVAEAKRELEQVKRQLLLKNRELLKADPTDLPTIARELQRLRVTFISLNELVTGMSDPTAKQEIGLLNKMVGSDGDEVLTTSTDADAEAATAERVRRAGIDPQSAENMVRGLRALQAVTQKPRPVITDGPTDPQ